VTADTLGHGVADGFSAQPPPLTSLSGEWLHPAAESEFALPTLQNFVGLVQVCWGPTGVQNWIMPPTGLPTPTGQLYALDTDGRPSRVGPEGTTYRWRPSEVLREHEVVSTRTRLHWDEAAITERLSFKQSGRFVLLFGGLCRTWSFTDYWNLPPEDVPQFNVSWDGSSVVVEDCKTFGVARITPSRSPAARTYLSIDDFYAGRPVDGPGRLVALELTAQAGQEYSWTAVQGTQPDIAPAGTDADVEQRWQEIWAAAFTPGNKHFSGSLPALDFGDEALNRLYYMGILTLLNSRRLTRPATSRSRFATGGQAIWAGSTAPLATSYTWGGSEGAPSTSFLWEVQLQAPLLARLDPAILRNQLEAFMRADMSNHWGIDVLTGRGVGMWYGVNDGAMITSAADYLRITGDLGWLDTSVDGVQVRDHLMRHVRNHGELSHGSQLADYGSAQNILECVSSYEHGVASFNAMGAWSYRFAADVLAPEAGQELRGRAEAIEQAVRGLILDDGVFRCETPEGPRVVRTCLDFIYVGRYMGDRLTGDERRRMLGFFAEELETSDWMRALSLEDSDSLTRLLPSFQTYRADHQSTGSYDGWPGLAASVRLSFGDTSATLDWLRRISKVTWEGPFGQAHWVGTNAGERHTRSATKASFFNGNCYLEACGCTLATVLLEDVAGTQHGAGSGAVRSEPEA